jgi:hypothetical protein
LTVDDVAPRELSNVIVQPSGVLGVAPSGVEIEGMRPSPGAGTLPMASCAKALADIGGVGTLTVVAATLGAEYSSAEIAAIATGKVRRMMRTYSIGISRYRASVSLNVTSKVREICLAFPGVEERVSHGSPAFYVGRQFVMLWPEGHHEHGFAHLWCAAAAGTQESLIATDGDRYFRPPYVGHRGWLGMRLDRRVSWSAVAERCHEGYLVTASPKWLAALTRDD